MEDEFNLDWIVRDNEEFAEKLPILAREVLERKIEYQDLGDESFDETVIAGMVEVMQDHLYSFEDMTSPEIEHCLLNLQIACEITVGLKEGWLEETDDGKIVSPKKEKT